MKDIKNPETRRRLIEEAFEVARDLYRQKKVEEAREPVLTLQDQFDEQGLDRLELLYQAESGLPGDSYWLEAIVEILLRQPQLGPDEMPYLQRLAMRSPENIALWQRILKERARRGDELLLFQARQQCAITLLQYFPSRDLSYWPDPATEPQAQKLFHDALEKAVDGIVESDSRDAASRDLLKAGQAHLPQHHGITRHLARIICSEDKRDRQGLVVVLKALEDAPDDVPMKQWAAKTLLELPGHFDEGLELLRDLHGQEPENLEILRDLVSALIDLEHLNEHDVPVLEAYVEQEQDDLRALEMLADHFAENEDLSERALAVYRRAAAHSPRRRVYLRLIGKASAERGEWSDVIEIFDEILASGQQTDDMILPLATAYAEFKREDPSAIKVYQQAVQQGSHRTEVHEFLCAHLYKTAPLAPDSVTQFKQTLTVCPDCRWARLGMAGHYVKVHDFGRALEESVKLLEAEPENQEAVDFGSQALAKDFSRRQLARLAHVDPTVIRKIFERAHELAPDATPIAMGLARRRIADGVQNVETARLLGDVCRKNPDAVDLRIARADMLWEMDEKENAVSLYRELLERWRAGAGTSTSGAGSDSENRKRILERVAEFLLEPPGPTEADVDIMLEAVALPDSPQEMVLGAARLLVNQRIDHPQRAALLHRALKLAPGDLKLERAMAETQTAEGNPTAAVHLAMRLMNSRQYDEEATNLLRGAVSVSKRPFLEEEDVERLREALRREGLPPTLLLVGVELIALHGIQHINNTDLLERLSEQLPRNVKVKRWLAQNLSQSGEHLIRAADIFGSLVDEDPHDPKLILELARTHARLGRREPQDLRVAQKAIELAPGDMDLLFHLAAIELDMGSYRAAAHHLEKVLDERPEMHTRVLALVEHTVQVTTRHGHLLLLLARVHIKAGRIEQALMSLGRLQRNYQSYLGEMVAAYSEIIELAPENPRARMERGILYRLSGQLEESLHDMEAAHQIAPHNMDILSEYAEVLTQKIKNSGDDAPEALTMKAAELYYHFGDEDNAVKMIELTLEKNPKNLGVMRLLAKLQLEAGERDSCRETLKMMPMDEGSLDLFQELARAYDEAQEHTKAAEVLTDAIEIGGAQTQLLEQLRNLHTEQAIVQRGASSRRRIMGELSDAARGRYELREELGKGAMGVVYKAYDRELDEIVVLKILPEHFAKNPDALKRFRNEAKAARKLAHPNIVRIHDIGEEGGRKHISMEFVAGGDLKTYLHSLDHGLEVDHAVQMIRETARALTHAHDVGVLHRDIKTANLLLSATGRVKLSDFGIAALFEAVRNELDGTGTGAIAGTPLYMSPEQFSGGALSPASDLYSVGIMFYELLTGLPPFMKGSISYHHQFTQPPVIEEIPERLWRVVDKLLQKDPKMRYQSARELLAELDHWQGRTGPRKGLSSLEDITQMKTPLVGLDEIDFE